MKEWGLWVCMIKWYSQGSMSYIPNDARIEVFPLAVGSQARPTLGAKFRLVGLLKKAPPTLGVGSVRLTSVATLPFCSETGVDVSYRRPSVTVRFFRTRMAS